MKVFAMASVRNTGDYYEIVSVTTNQEQYLEQGDQYINMALTAGEDAKSALSVGKRVFVPKNLANEITSMDLIIGDTDELEKKRLSLLFRARGSMTQAAAQLRAFDFFEFTMCNNHLASKGFFITDNNREEVYIQIINSGDEKIIETLERYLNLLDRISVPNYQYNAYLEFEESVMGAKTLEELSDIEKGYRYF